METIAEVERCLEAAGYAPFGVGQAGYEVYAVAADDVRAEMGASVAVLLHGPGSPDSNGLDEDGYPVGLTAAEEDLLAAYQRTLQAAGYQLVDFESPEMAWVPEEFGLR